MTLSVFADRAYYLALISPRDSYHRRAIGLSQTLNEPVVTSAWVVQELADGLSAPPTRAAFLTLLVPVASL
jgi:hypothetical protein